MTDKANIEFIFYNIFARYHLGNLVEKQSYWLTEAIYKHSEMKY